MVWQVEELQDANAAAEAARAARLAKMVEEVQAAVKRDLRGRDVYLTAVDMDLPGGSFTLKEEVAFREGEAVFAGGDEEETGGAAAEEGAEGEEGAAEAKETKEAVAVAPLDQVAAALGAAVRELAKRNEAPPALLVEAHTAEADSALSQQRANACKDYLMAKVVALEAGLKAGEVGGMITAKGCGSSVMAKQAVTFKVDMKLG